MEPQRQDIQKLTSAIREHTKALRELIRALDTIAFFQDSVEQDEEK